MTVLESQRGLNEEQLAAVEADGSVFVAAGAGTGKTSVLVERYVRAVCERGIDVESILVITYTRKAAGELRTRIRAALRERGRPDLARELDVTVEVAAVDLTERLDEGGVPRLARVVARVRFELGGPASCCPMSRVAHR